MTDLKRFATCVMLLAIAAISACQSGSGGSVTVADVARPVGQAGSTDEVLNCELKNGPTGCYSERIGAIDSYVAELETFPDSPRRNLEQAYALSEKMDVMSKMASGSNEPAMAMSAPPVAEASAAVEAEAAAGGCVWKEQTYEPGQSIRSVNDGTIMSSDLYINGQDFESLSGQPGPWQGCDCGSSSGQWGCV